MYSFPGCQVRSLQSCNRLKKSKTFRIFYSRQDKSQTGIKMTYKTSLRQNIHWYKMLYQCVQKQNQREGRYHVHNKAVNAKLKENKLSL